MGLGVLLLALAVLTCAKALLTAPPGSSLTLFANPPFISANGGVSVISAFCIEPAGMPCPDGTVMQCFTTLGRVDPQAETKDGVARFNLVSDSRSGMATVTCVSGGPAVAASVAPSPSPSTSPSASPGPVTGGTVTSGNGSASTTVVIGSSLPVQVVVVADPPRIDGPGGQTRVVATVYDASGNPVANVPVIFTVAVKSGACGIKEFFDSGSQPIFTDTNGQAADVMHTRRQSTDSQVLVTVTATVPNGKTGATDVTINAVPGPAPAC
ncbi:MAG TPA: hypothetical protein VN461_08160 [Vicinamibacteria bacterium]|nr:hypothetical protein [Vicinamibacteria bacterium]